ncbi:hypothetical protein [Rugosimonospora africana]|uniref:Uncharacterized protein n=1 Tax=Rugosimonospora africana TaxID=556532 RepID=A0A8J3VV46_9ACTN|nr:hypothetical protein [Rugosimonospora africana]GIH20247.1 hypothetical protein Raf01_84190 [Rugosimonospora africana]
MGSEEPSPQPSRPEPSGPAEFAELVEPAEPAEPDGPAKPAGPAEPAVAIEPVEAEIEASRGDGRWSVARTGWRAVVPDLPEGCAELLATPIVVSVEAQDDDDRSGGDDDEEDQAGRHRAPDDPSSAAGRYEYRPSFLAPVGLRSKPRARHRV